MNPDATGNYTLFGTYDGHDYYRRDDGDYFIWWDAGYPAWTISAALGIQGAAYWQLDTIPITGLYIHKGTATGDATLT